VEDNKNAAIVPQGIGFIKPLVGVDEAVEAFNEYQKLKNKLKGPGDFVGFKDRQGNIREAPTKQWRAKLTRFFGITCEFVEEQTENLPDGSFIVKCRYRAVAPNGLSMEADGSCWSKTKVKYDEFGNPKLSDLYHDTRSHAHTRAKNRAVFELLGFGEVSAEELDDESLNEESPKPEKPKVKLDTPMTASQRNLILNLAGHWEKDKEKRDQYLKSNYDFDLSTATKAEASALIERLEAAIRADKGQSSSQQTPDKNDQGLPLR